MAENNPRESEKKADFNTWGHIAIPKENGLYDAMDSIKESTDAFFESVMAIFELVNTFLDFIASLLIDFSNPLKPIIDEIIAFLESFINDLRNLGLYITADTTQILGDNVVEDLSGGYAAYEQRVIRKLIDVSDPTRPNFSDGTKVFAINFFAGGDISQTTRILAYIKKLIKFFTPGLDLPASAPINVEAVYYNDVVGEIELPNSYKPDGIRVKWKLPRPVSTNSAFPSSFVLPDYFIFSVATRNSGDRIGYINKVTIPSTDGKSKDDPGKTKSSSQRFKNTPHLTDARLWPLVGSNTNHLTKLDESITINPLPETPEGVGKRGSWILYNNEDIYFNKINDEKISEIYKCFIYGGGVDSVVGDDDFSFDIPFENLKTQGQLKDEYFITMYSMTSESNDFNTINFDKTDLRSSSIFNARFGKQYDVKSADILTSFGTGESDLGIASGSHTISSASNTVNIKAPSDLKTKYIKAVRFFFLGYVLARLDDPFIKSHIGFQDFTTEEEKLFQKYAKADDGWKALIKNVRSRQEFAREVLEWVDDIMFSFKYKIPSDGVLFPNSAILNQIDNFPYDLYELIESAAKGISVEGLWMDGNFLIKTEKFLTQADYNSSDKYSKEIVPYVGDDEETLDALLDGDFSYKSFITDKTSGFASPILYFPNEFTGNLIFVKDFTSLWNESRRLVMVSNTSEETGQWIAIRPFRDSDLSSFLSVMEIVKKYLEGFLKGLEGIVTQILKYIHLIKTRIAQLQDIILKIKALIDLILGLRLPLGMYFTYHMTDGTPALVNAVQQAQDKPDIGPGGVGTGFMVVGGGVPSLLVDLLIAISGGDPSGLPEG